MTDVLTILAVLFFSTGQADLSLISKNQTEDISRDSWAGTWPFSSNSGRLACFVEEEKRYVLFYPDTPAVSNYDGEEYEVQWFYLTTNQLNMWQEVVTFEEVYSDELTPEELMTAIEPIVDHGDLLCF